MADSDSATGSTGITDVAASIRDVPMNNDLIVDYSPNDDDDLATADATRDTLTDGLVSRLFRPCIDQLDQSVQCTRLSQIELKHQLNLLTTELKRLSLVQHDYLFATASPPLSQSSSVDNKVISPTVNLKAKTSIDTCTLLDKYARRLSGARAKIAVVGNILESTQARLRTLSHRIDREHNNRRSLLEPQVVVPTSTTIKEPELVDYFDKDIDNVEINHDEKYHKDETDPDEVNEKQKELIDNTMVSILPKVLESQDQS